MCHSRYSIVFALPVLDGDLDLATGRHHYYGPSRIHAFLNEGPQKGIPRFRGVTGDLKLQPLPLAST